MFTRLNEHGKAVIELAKYKKAGLHLNDKGVLEEFNANAFARHLSKIFDVFLRYDSRYYLYTDNFHQAVTELQLQRLLYDYLNSLVKDAWTIFQWNTHILRRINE